MEGPSDVADASAETSWANRRGECQIEMGWVAELGVAEMWKYVPVKQREERPNSISFGYIAAKSKQRIQHKRPFVQLPNNPTNKTQPIFHKYSNPLKNNQNRNVTTLARNRYNLQPPPQI